MATLGNSTTGFTFTISGSFGDVAGGAYTVPSPGIIVTAINAVVGGNGTTPAGRLYVWQQSGAIPGTWLIRGASTFTLPASNALQTQSSLAANGAAGISSDLYLPAGTVIWIGAYSSTGVMDLQGKGSGTATELGNTADGNWNDHGPASAVGQMAAYITYNALPAPTLTSASPAVAPAGATTTLTGTGLLHTTGITVCGVTATTYTINSDTSITVTVPAGASGSGTIVVTTPAGTASTAFTAGQIFYGTGTAVASIKAIWYGDPSGSGVVHQAVGVWVPTPPSAPTGVKRVW
ncbi:MAG: IPT/TIG domain-containing protein [Ktedonobacterales bacterium]